MKMPDLSIMVVFLSELLMEIILYFFLYFTHTALRWEFSEIIETWWGDCISKS